MMNFRGDSQKILRGTFILGQPIDRYTKFVFHETTAIVLHC